MVTSRSSEDLANNVFIDVESSRGQYHYTIQSHKPFSAIKETALVFFKHWQPILTKYIIVWTNRTFLVTAHARTSTQRRCFEVISSILSYLSDILCTTKLSFLSVYLCVLWFIDMYLPTA